MFPFRYGRRNSGGVPWCVVCAHARGPCLVFSCEPVVGSSELVWTRTVVVRLRVVVLVEGLCDKPSAY